MNRQQRYRNKLKVIAKGILNFRCVHCFSSKSLEFAHKVPTKLNGTGRGQRTRYKDVVDNPGKYMLLCKYHHMEYDQT